MNDSPVTDDVNALHHERLSRNLVQLTDAFLLFNTIPSRDRRFMHFLTGSIRSPVKTTAPRAAFRDHIAHVVSLSPDEEMVRIYTFPIITFMEHEHTFGDRSHMELPRYPMSFLGFPIGIKRTVSTLKKCAIPFPASGRRVVNMSEEVSDRMMTHRSCPFDVMPGAFKRCLALLFQPLYYTRVNRSYTHTRLCGRTLRLVYYRRKRPDLPLSRTVGLIRRRRAYSLPSQPQYPTESPPHRREGVRPR